MIMEKDLEYMAGYVADAKVCEYFGISAKTTYRWRCQGLRAKKIGRFICYKKEMLQKFLDKLENI